MEYLQELQEIDYTQVTEPPDTMAITAASMESQATAQTMEEEGSTISEGSHVTG